MSDQPNDRDQANNPEQPNQPNDKDPLQEILPCLFQALIAAMPVAIQVFFACISGNTPPGTAFKPGDRTRCR